MSRTHVRTDYKCAQDMDLIEHSDFPRVEPKCWLTGWRKSNGGAFLNRLSDLRNPNCKARAAAMPGVFPGSPWVTIP